MRQKKHKDTLILSKSIRMWALWGILLALFAGVSLEMLLQWRSLEGFWEQAGLRYEEGGLSAEQIEAYQKKQREGGRGEEQSAVDIAAWKRETRQRVSVKELGRSAVGTVIWVSGTMELVLPGQWKCGGLPISADSEGCAISSSLAFQLYGTTNVVGNSLELGERKLVVRGVLEQKEPFLALLQKDPAELLPFVEIRTRGRSPAATLSRIAAGLGLFGEAYAFTGSFYVSLARLLISLPLWCLYFWLAGRFLKWCRRKRWLGLLGKGLFLLGLGAGLFLSLSFTSDFIPARWSDFSFWGRKLSELAGWAKARREFPEIFWEGEVIGCVRRIGAGALAGAAGIVGLAFRRSFASRPC